MVRKKSLLAVTVVFVVILTACSAVSAACPPQGSAICDPQLPHVTTDSGWWIDMTGQASPETMAALEAESDAISKDGFQLAGLIVANAASDPSKVASDFGNLNGIGSEDKDNGVVILVLLDKEGDDGNAPYIFMAPGNGLSYLTATKLGQIRDQVFKPARAEGNWERGLIDVTVTIHKIMLDPKAGEYLDSPETGMGILGTILLIVVLILVVLLVLGILADGGLGGDGSSSGGFLSGGGSSGLGGGGGFSGGGSGG